MADVTPDWNVQQQKLRVQLLSLKTNAERIIEEIMDIDSRRVRALTNLAASREAQVEIKKNLDAMVEEHGEVEYPLDL